LFVGRRFSQATGIGKILGKTQQPAGFLGGEGVRGGSSKRNLFDTVSKERKKSARQKTIFLGKKNGEKGLETAKEFV